MRRRGAIVEEFQSRYARDYEVEDCRSSTAHLEQLRAREPQAAR